MNRLFLIAFAFLTALGTLLLSPGTASAQSRTWVSGVGNDANPCSRTAPCKTFAGALAVTAAKGEINCLDAGAFGTVTITKSISIICNNTQAGVLASGVSGIVVNVLAADQVTLEGLDINGIGTGINGINIIGNGTTFIRNCQVRGFTGNGINLVGTAGARAVIENADITYNNGGINVDGTGASATAANISNVMLDGNTSFAVKVGPADGVVLTDNFMAGSTNSLVITAGGVAVSYVTNVLRNPGVPNQNVPQL